MRRGFDAVELALHDRLFAACAEEMGVTLMRTAHSPNIKERLDHSCALFDRAGRLVAQAAHIPVHLGSMPGAVEAALARGPFRAGDVVLLNDPYAGGTHLPDLTLVSPVFLGRGRTPDFFVASRAHHADVGGAAPGSMPLAREVYEEGLRVPPTFLARAGIVDRDVLGLLLANVRTPDERRADLDAQLGAQITGVRRLQDLARRGGPQGATRLRAAAAALQRLAERQVRTALAALPRGRFTAHDQLDDDGIGMDPVRLVVAVERRGRSLRVDFTGTDPQSPGPVNAVASVTRAATWYAVRCLLGDIPINHGTFRPIEIHAPSGTVLNPRPPAAVNAGNVETSQRVVDVVLAALARMLPGRLPAASSGTMNNLLIGGFDPRAGRPYAYYETLAGGHGGAAAGPGESAMQAHMTNTRNTPIEALEHAYPFRVERTSIRLGSGGAGRARGGDGVIRSLRMLGPARVTVISERRRRGPYGMAGGKRGRPGVNRLRLAHGSSMRLPGKFQRDVPAGAVVTIESPGGGGFGAPRRVRSARPPRTAKRQSRRPRSGA